MDTSNRLALVCQNCGAVLPAPGAQCTVCGTDQKDVEIGADEMRDSLRARSVRPQITPAKVGLVSSLRPERPTNSGRTPVVVGGAIVVLLAAGAGAFILMKPENKSAAITTSAAATNEAPAPAPSSEQPANDDTKQIKLSAAWPRAQAKAREWNKDAVLVSFKAGPLKGSGTVDTATGASVTFLFGVPESGSLSTNPNVGSDRFSLSIDAQGTHTDTVKGSGSSRAAAEPACAYDEAIQKGKASGFANDRPFFLRYEYSSEREKSLWILETADDPKAMRALDGYSCAIVVH